MGAGGPNRIHLKVRLPDEVGFFLTSGRLLTSELVMEQHASVDCLRQTRIPLAQNG